ncbi:tetratricopeptide repeat protein [Solimonas sp. K1W22B-7]|uniref:tetratricopeptide repeat protein n=1 Tax=Solimonas sp. K1W22B-7 TaxID=2303331 RepID=UPI0013C47125|nr:tetratricopeptide repeat protein [Solimonas sp. K1W22B-7]
MTFRKNFLAGLMAAAVALTLVAADAKEKDKGKPVPPPTKQTQVIRAETYKKMEAAQKAFEAKDYKGSLAALEGLRAGEAKLNDYERATLYNLYAATYYSMDNVPKAIESYATVLKQPNLPEGLRDNSLYAMSQLYFIVEDYPRAIAVVNKWLSVVAEPSPEGYALLAQAYYQTQKFPEAEKALTTSIRISTERGQAPKEAALALLRAIYYERKEYAKAAKVLEILVRLQPGKDTYWQQLAGMRGLMDQQLEQVNLLHAAYRGKLISRESDLLNLARLYMVQQAPFPAVRVMTQGFKNKTIRMNVENLQLYAQALALSREFKQQIPILKKVAGMSGEAKHYVYLGQAYNEVGDWDSAADAFKEALKARNLDKRADAHMQLGTALFNANHYAEARQHFVSAAESPALAQAAGNWIKFVDQEIARREAVGNL